MEQHSDKKEKEKEKGDTKEVKLIWNETDEQHKFISNILKKVGRVSTLAFKKEKYQSISFTTFDWLQICQLRLQGSLILGRTKNF